MTRQNYAKVGLSCGREYLEINGVVVAMEGDACRDPEIIGDLTEHEEMMARDGFLFAYAWNSKRLQRAADKINGSTS